MKSLIVTPSISLSFRNQLTKLTAAPNSICPLTSMWSQENGFLPFYNMYLKPYQCKHCFPLWLRAQTHKDFHIHIRFRDLRWEKLSPHSGLVPLKKFLHSGMWPPGSTGRVRAVSIFYPPTVRPTLPVSGVLTVFYVSTLPSTVCVTL